MSDTFNDATQEYINESGASTTITNISNDDLLAIPTTSDANNLIKLVSFASINNLYILQANSGGEIRFLTLNAKNTNDQSGNLLYNTKIDVDGNLNYYHSFTIFNPVKFSGWYSVDGSFSSVENQLTLLDVQVATLTGASLAAASQISTLQTELGAVGTLLNTTIGGITILEGEVNAINTRLSFQTSPLRPSAADQVAGDNSVLNLSNAMAAYDTSAEPIAQVSRATATSRYSTLALSFTNNLASATAGIAFVGGVYALIRQILDDKKKDKYEFEILGITETLSKIAISTTQDRLIHTGITITSGNTGFTTSNTTYSIAIQRSAKLVIYISSSLIASVVNVEEVGTSTFTIGETITITKAQLGGGTGGNLVLSVAFLGTLKTWTELRTTYLQEKIDGIKTKGRRKGGVIGVDDIDTGQFTTTNVSYTDTTDPINETITYKQLKSRLNILPTGASDVDIYTSTGQVGIGTAPAVKLHTYHATNNILRLETSTTGTNSIEFRRGTANDVFTDYRLISDTGVFKLQFENNLLAYGASGTELFNTTSTLTTIYKNTSFSGNVGINVAPHATYKLDVNGDINISTGSLLRVNGVAYKPAEAVLADTASALASGTILGTGQGGTGASTHTAGNVILGNGSGALTSATGLNWNSGTTSLNAPNVNVPTGGKYRINSVDLALTDLTGTLAVGKGGTGSTTFTANGLLIGNTTSAITQNAGLTFITSTLTAPNVNVPTGGKYRINSVDLALTDLTGTLAVNKGGTGQTTFTANGLLIGNTASAITQDAGLTFATSTLTAPNMNVPTGGKYKINNVDLSYNDLTNKLTAGTNISISATNEISATGGGTAYTAGDGIAISVANAISLSGITTNSFTISASGSIDMFILQNNPTNSLRVRQNFISVNDFSYNIIQKTNNVDYPAITFRNGQLGIGTLNNPSYPLEVVGDINISGDYRKGSVLFKPATAVLADTATDLATGAILSVAKGGTGANTFTAGRLLVGNTASALQGYAGLTWTTATNLLTTTNLSVGTNSTLTGNVGIGTTPSGVATTKLDVLGDVNIVGKTTHKGTLECLTLNPATPTIPTALTIIPTPTFTFTPASTITRCAILTYQGTGTGTTYSVAIPAGGMLCDILMVGGGGSGGRDIGAGGGGGAVLYAQNVLLKQDTYMVSVGRGAIYGSGEQKGQSTTGFGATLLGGGSAGDAGWNGATYANDGGSGAGGKSVPDEWSRRGGRPIVGGSIKGGILENGVISEGRVGGYGVVQNNNQVVSSGGGGAGAVGGNGQTSTTTGSSAVASSGGNGVSTTILDTTYFWGGGGGGGSYQYTFAANGGNGGGGAGNNNNSGGITAYGFNGGNAFFGTPTGAAVMNGINGTGGGGGGGGFTTGSAGSGGAGVIIIRYRRPINHNETIDFLPTGTNATMTTKQGMIGANYKIEASVSSIIVDALTIDANTASTSIKNSGLVVKSSTNDTLITNNCGIGIDPSSTYKLNVNGDLNVNGTIWQNGFSVNAGFQQYRTFNFTYSGDTNFLLTTRARYCNIICFCSTNAGWIASNGANMAVGEFRGALGFGGGVSNGVNNYFFYWTMQGDNPRPFKAWFGNGNNTTFTFLEMWYN